MSTPIGATKNISREADSPRRRRRRSMLERSCGLEALGREHAEAPLAPLLDRVGTVLDVVVEPFVSTGRMLQIFRAHSQSINA